MKKRIGIVQISARTTVKFRDVEIKYNQNRIGTWEHMHVDLSCTPSISFSVSTLPKEKIPKYGGVCFRLKSRASGL